jgi:hypothetical protein
VRKEDEDIEIFEQDLAPYFGSGFSSEILHINV